MTDFTKDGTPHKESWEHTFVMELFKIESTISYFRSILIKYKSSFSNKAVRDVDFKYLIYRAIVSDSKVIGSIIPIGIIAIS